MSMQDPISDLFTRIRNAQRAGKETVEIGFSRFILAVSELLVAEGYVQSCEAVGESSKKKLLIKLKYFQGKPVIDLIKRVSRPGLRIYKACPDLPKVLGGLGVAIVSTSQGLMSDRQARQAGLGGEIIGYVA